MNSMIQAGPLTVVLIFRPSCPHCVTYKPIWEELTKVKGRTAHMISVNSEDYEKTPLASKKQVTGVPTVLYVNSNGKITEAPAPRDKTIMTEVIRTARTEPTPVSNQSSQPSQQKVLSPLNALRSNQPTASPSPLGLNMLLRASQVASPQAPQPTVQFAQPLRQTPPPQITVPTQQVMLPPAQPLRPLTTPKINQTAFAVSPQTISDRSPRELMNPVIPGTMVRESDLSIRPGTPIPSVLTGGYQQQQQQQRGGDPWSALVFAAQQAAPAAALLGAYAALPARRSSGLGPAKRKTRKSKSQLSQLY